LQELVREMVEEDAKLYQHNIMVHDKRMSRSMHERCQSEGELSFLQVEPTFKAEDGAPAGKA
jgi:hypothetical protein